MTITFVPMSGSHFLLMDDDPGRAQRVTGVLRETGQQVVQVSDGREAVRALEAQHAIVITAGRSLSYLTAIDEAMGRRSSAVASR